MLLHASAFFHFPLWFFFCSLLPPHTVDLHPIRCHPTQITETLKQPSYNPWVFFTVFYFFSPIFESLYPVLSLLVLAGIATSQLNCLVWAIGRGVVEAAYEIEKHSQSSYLLSLLLYLFKSSSAAEVDRVSFPNPSKKKG